MKKTLVSFFACSILVLAQGSVESVTPLNGTGPSATFTSVYRHPGGVNQNYLGYLLILPTPNIVWFTAKGSCLIEYNRISNGMRLIDNAGTGWLGPIVGVPVGPGGTTLSNNFCSVNTAAVTKTLAGTDMTVTVPVVFHGTFTGPLGTFIQSQDVNGLWTGMTQFGNWTAYPISTQKPGPYIKSLTVPAYSSVGPLNVDVVGGATNGLNNLAMVHILVAQKIVGGTSRCHAIYFLDTNQIRLVNDAGDGFAGGFYTGSENSTCAIGSLNGDSMYASRSGNEVRVHVPMTFKSSVTGRLSVWVNAFDNAGNLTHWIGAQ